MVFLLHDVHGSVCGGKCATIGARGPGPGYVVRGIRIVSGASAVVTIKMPGGVGRGFLTSEQDHVVTNDHLIGFLK